MKTKARQAYSDLMNRILYELDENSELDEDSGYKKKDLERKVNSFFSLISNLNEELQDYYIECMLIRTSGLYDANELLYSLDEVLDIIYQPTSNANNNQNIDIFLSKIFTKMNELKMYDPSIVLELIVLVENITSYTGYRNIRRIENLTEIIELLSSQEELFLCLRDLEDLLINTERNTPIPTGENDDATDDSDKSDTEIVEINSKISWDQECQFFSISNRHLISLKSIIEDKSIELEFTPKQNKKIDDLLAQIANDASKASIECLKYLISTAKNVKQIVECLESYVRKNNENETREDEISQEDGQTDTSSVDDFEATRIQFNEYENDGLDLDSLLRMAGVDPEVNCG